jgi:hypothetical protein
VSAVCGTDGRGGAVRARALRLRLEDLSMRQDWGPNVRQGWGLEDYRLCEAASRESAAREPKPEMTDARRSRQLASWARRRGNAVARLQLRAGRS